jgi:hypothetical protein
VGRFIQRPSAFPSAFISLPVVMFGTSPTLHPAVMDTMDGRGFDMFGYHQPGQPTTAYGGVGFGLSGVGPMCSNLGVGGGMSMMGTPMGGPGMMGMTGGMGGGAGAGASALGMGLSSRGMGVPGMQPASGFVLSYPPLSSMRRRAEEVPSLNTHRLELLPLVVFRLRPFVISS